MARVNLFLCTLVSWVALLWRAEGGSIMVHKELSELGYMGQTSRPLKQFNKKVVKAHTSSQAWEKGGRGCFSSIPPL